MEKYVLLRGKVTGKWYDFDRKAHYHIIVAVKEDENNIKEYDISINIGSVLENSDEFYSSNLQVYYDNNYTYNNKILKEMLLQKPGITIGRKNFIYVVVKSFEHMPFQYSCQKDFFPVQSLHEFHFFMRK